MFVVAALLLCTILPSPVAFTSLVSAAAVPTITAYALICFGRCFLTAGKFSHAAWSLGKWSRPLTFIALIWNLYLAAVLFSPIEFPVTAQTFNCTYNSFHFFELDKLWRAMAWKKFIGSVAYRLI